MGNAIDKLSKKALRQLSPSPLVLRFSEQLVAQAGSRPILDVACGGGRNAVLLAYLGGYVIGIDHNVSQFRADDFLDTPFESCHKRIQLRQQDLVTDEWPFQTESVGGIVNVHFLHLPLLPFFWNSLGPHGIVLLETIPAHGGNYVSLPKRGEIMRGLTKPMSVIHHQERPAGPPQANAVTARLVAMKLVSALSS